MRSDVAARVADARLTGPPSQQVFDVVLRTLAEPGTIGRLPAGLDARIPTAAWLALALADVDIAVAVIGTEPTTGSNNNAQLSQLITEATGATAVPAQQAWLVVAPHINGVADGQLDAVAVGTELAPERGARLGLAVGGLFPHHRETPDATGTGGQRQPGCVVDLTGPGVPVRRTVAVAGLSPGVAARLGTATGLFPCGFDTWLFTPDGHVMAVPRSTSVTVDQASERKL